MECGSPILGWVLHSLIRTNYPWYFMRKCIGSYGAFMVDVSLLFMLVMSITYDKLDVWLSSCFDLQMNVQ